MFNSINKCNISLNNIHNTQEYGEGGEGLTLKKRYEKASCLTTQLKAVIEGQNACNMKMEEEILGTKGLSGDRKKRVVDKNTKTKDVWKILVESTTNKLIPKCNLKNRV